MWVFWFGVVLDLLPMGFLVVFLFVAASRNFMVVGVGVLRPPGAYVG